MNRNPISSIGSPIQKYLEAVHACYRDLDEGEVASYIPELFKADPHWFGICIATNDGQIYEVGEEPSRLYDPIHLEALRLWNGDGGLRRRGCTREDRRRAQWRRLQLHQPASRDGLPP